MQFWIVRAKWVFVAVGFLGVASVVASFALAQTTFHQGTEYCGSVRHHAARVQDSDACDDALSSRSVDSSVALTVGVTFVAIGVGGPMGMRLRARHPVH